MFYVIETQTTGETGASIVTTHSSEAEAEQKYHLVLSSAAVSEVEKHGAILVKDDYTLIKREIYDKTTDAEPEERIMTNES